MMPGRRFVKRGKLILRRNVPGKTRTGATKPAAVKGRAAGNKPIPGKIRAAGSQKLSRNKRRLHRAAKRPLNGRIAARARLAARRNVRRKWRGTKRLGLPRKKTVLVVDHFVPHYDKDTGSRNTHQIMTLLSGMGLNVRFAGYDYERYEPYTSELERKGIKVISGRLDRFAKWLKRNGRFVDYAYVLRPHVGDRYMDVIRRHTRAQIIYNSVDFGFLRELRRYELEHNPVFLANSVELKKREYELFAKSDVVVTVSEYEKSLLEQDMAGKRIVVIPTFFYEAGLPLGVPNGFEMRSAITFVGGFNHSPNIDGVLWFVNDILPLVREQLPDVSFNVVGSNPPDEIMALHGGGIQVTGYISDEELERYYSLTKVVVAPLRYGAGVKGKIIEAVAHGIPVVTTEIGIEGIKDPGEAILPAESPESFAAQIVDLFYNPERWQRIRETQIEYANRYLHIDYAKGTLQEVFRP